MCCNCCKKGAPGPIGYGFLVSTGAPVDPPVDNRIYYLDLDTGDIYEWDGSTWQLIGTLGGGAPINQTYNIISPNTEGDTVNITLDRRGGKIDGSSLGDITFAADKIGSDDSITISIVSPDGITFNGGLTSVVLGLNVFSLTTELETSVELPAGSYNFTLNWVGTSVNRTQNVTLNLT